MLIFKQLKILLFFKNLYIKIFAGLKEWVTCLINHKIT